VSLIGERGRSEQSAHTGEVITERRKGGGVGRGEELEGTRSLSMMGYHRDVHRQCQRKRRCRWCKHRCRQLETPTFREGGGDRSDPVGLTVRTMGSNLKMGGGKGVEGERMERWYRTRRMQMEGWVSRCFQILVTAPVGLTDGTIEQPS
jgi:hypothetical protein